MTTRVARGRTGARLTDMGCAHGDRNPRCGPTVLRGAQLRAIQETRDALRQDGVPAFEAKLLPDRRLIRRGQRRFVAIKHYEAVSGEVTLRFDLADQNRRPLLRFGVLSGVVIQAVAEADHEAEKLPVSAVAIAPDGEPAKRAELMLTVSYVQVAGEFEPEPLMCFARAREDRTPLHSFALGWRVAMLALSLAFEERPGDFEKAISESGTNTRGSGALSIPTRLE